MMWVAVVFVLAGSDPVGHHVALQGGPFTSVAACRAGAARMSAAFGQAGLPTLAWTCAPRPVPRDCGENRFRRNDGELLFRRCHDV